MKEPVIIRIVFADHVPPSQQASLVSQISSNGRVIALQRGSISVAISRFGRLSSLRHQLVGWERHGFLRWSHDTADRTTPESVNSALTRGC